MTLILKKATEIIPQCQGPGRDSSGDFGMNPSGTKGDYDPKEFLLFRHWKSGLFSDLGRPVEECQSFGLRRRKKNELRALLGRGLGHPLRCSLWYLQKAKFRTINVNKCTNVDQSDINYPAVELSTCIFHKSFNEFQWSCTRWSYATSRCRILNENQTGIFPGGTTRFQACSEILFCSLRKIHFWYTGTLAVL